MKFRKIAARTGALLSLLKKRPKGTGDFLLSSLSYLFRLRRVLGRPTFITLEIASACNVKCPLCETGTGELERPKRFLKVESFRKIADQIAPFTNTVMLYFMGETFLNPHVYGMIRYLKEKGIFVTACTSGDLIEPADLVSSGMDDIVFQIGGTTPDVHAMYRIGSNLSKILENVRQTIQLRNAKGFDIPKVKLGFIIMKHNEYQIADFYRLATELKADDAEIVNTGVRDFDQAKSYLPSNRKYWNYSPEEYEKGMLVPRIRLNNDCAWLYYSTVITVDGDVIPCCRDPHARVKMGNVFVEPFARIWNNSTYRNFRNLIRSNQRSCRLCDLCWGFGVPFLNDARPMN